MADLEEIWKEDLLGFKEVGESFGNLIKSIDDTKVVSIEAGYGRGKTFFRERWAKQLKAQGEVVVEVDALMSDHSGDPVLTFIAALVAALPEKETSTGKKLLSQSKKYSGVALRSVLKLALRQGADEVIDTVTGKAADAIAGENEALQAATEEFGDGLSKMAGELIAAQVMAERVRTQELPEQLQALRDALTIDADNKRVVILVDELDRCHPDYAIAFLEAMKLVFDQDGFVFCLFVNADYLQRVADHRFGKLQDGEQYLDKFVDIRLKLPQREDAFEVAAIELVLGLPEFVPLASRSEFSRKSAAAFAGEIAQKGYLSMRQIERLVDKLDLIIRFNGTRALDLHLLICLGVKASFEGEKDPYNWAAMLPRSQVAPGTVDNYLGTEQWGRPNGVAKLAIQQGQELFPELFDLSRIAYGIPDDDSTDYADYFKVSKFLSPHYIPSHQAMLDAVYKFDVDA